MIIRNTLVYTASLLAFSPLAVHSLSVSDIPADTPISQLVASANTNLAQGNYNDALTYFDVAIARDSQNYLTIFKRGATYLSLGKTAQAGRDFDRVLEIKPGFEGALLQRAKIHGKTARWEAAIRDYLAAGKTPDGEEIVEVEGAETAAKAAVEAEQRGDWETCVQQSGIAIVVANTALSLRQVRARCRFERGEVQEGVSDLAHVLQMSPGSIEPHLQMSAMLFYSLGDLDRGLAQIRKCLHSDPDSKPCSKMFRRQKQLKKVLDKVNMLTDLTQYNSAQKLLLPSGEDAGLIQDIKDEVKALREAGTIHPKAPDELILTVVEQACECFSEMKSHKRAKPWCEEALSLDPNSLAGLLSKARQQLDADDFEGALNTLNIANEHHQGHHNIQHMQNEAQTLLRRSKQKDYYKVLGVSRDADGRTIKHVYRKMTKQYHPDKAHKLGMSKEEAEKKMATINEAYEVLSNPELKARFDAGDDPNSQEQQGHPFHGSPFGQGGGGQQFFFHQGGSGGQQQFKFHGFQGGFPGF